MTEETSVADKGITDAPLAGDIKNLIMSLRGMQIMLDSDVARLYGYETKYINRAASRNIDRFPPEFRFQLTGEGTQQVLRFHFGTSNDKDNDEFLRFQNGTSSRRGTETTAQHGGKRYRPFVYTEHGVIALAGVLRNDTAVHASIAITKAFVEMRKIIATNRYVFDQITDINSKLLNHDSMLFEQRSKIDHILAILSEPETSSQWLFFKGQFYDAFKLTIGIIRQAKNKITVIDNYVDNSVLEMLSNKKAQVQVTIITANPSRLSKQHLDKFIAQHGETTVVTSKDFHDRFIILDNKEVYVFGGSLKDLGKRCFGVFKSEDSEELLKRVNNIVST